MVWDWIELKTLAVARAIAARIDRRWYDVIIRPDRVVVIERPTARQRSFYLLRQLEAFCDGLGSEGPPPTAERASDGAVVPWRARWQPRQSATQEELKNDLARLHETIAVLRNKRRQAEADRDRWERIARELEAELRGARGVPMPEDDRRAITDKFRRAKTVVARLTHPDSTGGTGIEATIREKLFREFWAEFERIEAES